MCFLVKNITPRCSVSVQRILYKLWLSKRGGARGQPQSPTPKKFSLRQPEQGFASSTPLNLDCQWPAQSRQSAGVVGTRLPGMVLLLTRCDQPQRSHWSALSLSHKWGW